MSRCVKEALKRLRGLQLNTARLPQSAAQEVINFLLNLFLASLCGSCDSSTIRRYLMTMVIKNL